MCIIHIGTTKDFIDLIIKGRVKQDSQDSWDANWLICSAEASSQGFSGKINWQIRNEDLDRFLQRIEVFKMHEGAEALFDTLDGWVDIRIRRRETDGLEALCCLNDNPAGGNAFEFLLLFDYASLDELSHQLKYVLKRYPYIGK